MIDILILLGVITIFCVVAWFVLSQIDLPDPIRKIVIIVLVIVAGVLAIGFLLSFRGGNHSFRIGELSQEVRSAEVKRERPDHHGKSLYVLSRIARNRRA